MSLNFSTIAAENFKGTLQATPISFGQAPSRAPWAVIASVDWSLYSASSAKANVNVICNLQGGSGPIPYLDRILSVKIDNLGNPNPVYVNFLDTPDTVACPANTIVWEPVVTNSRIANIIGEGFTDGNIGTTRVYFTNVFMPPWSDAEISQAVALYKGSLSTPRIPSRSFPGYAAPALGDQTRSFTINLGAAQDIPITPWSNLAQPNSVYLTFGNAYLDLVSVGTGFIVSIIQPDASGFQFIPINPNVLAPGPVQIWNIQGNIILPTNGTWIIRVGATSVVGSLCFRFVYSINPQ